MDCIDFCPWVRKIYPHVKRYHRWWWHLSVDVFVLLLRLPPLRHLLPLHRLPIDVQFESRSRAGSFVNWTIVSRLSMILGGAVCTTVQFDPSLGKEQWNDVSREHGNWGSFSCGRWIE